MKISFALLAVFLLLAVGGCANPPARGGSSDASIEGLSQSTETTATAGQEDYRRILADPGPF